MSLLLQSQQAAQERVARVALIALHTSRTCHFVLVVLLFDLHSLCILFSLIASVRGNRRHSFLLHQFKHAFWHFLETFHARE